MIGVDYVRTELEGLRSQYSARPGCDRGLENHVAEDWMRATGLTRRQLCEVIAAWLVFGFASGRLTYPFADLLANNMHWVAQAAAPVGTSDILEFMTPLCSETFLAFDAGEFTFEPDFDPVEGNTRPMVAAIVQRIEALAEYSAALAGLTLSEPAATS